MSAIARSCPCVRIGDVRDRRRLVARAPLPAIDPASVTLRAMESVNPFSRMHAHVGNRLRDRARAHSFFRFVGRRFLDDRLFESAGALSFTTVFALVPLSMVVFGVLSAFPVFEQ